MYEYTYTASGTYICTRDDDRHQHGSLSLRSYYQKYYTLAVIYVHTAYSNVFNYFSIPILPVGRSGAI